MAFYKVQHIFRGAGGTSLDDYVNTFFLTGPAGDAHDPTMPAAFGEWTLVCDGICDLYIHPDGVGVTPGEYMSHRLYGTDETVKVYSMSSDLAGAPLTGSPSFVHHKVATAGLPDVQGLPEEMAVALSYSALNAGEGTGSFRARRRGRIFIGPLSIAAMDDVAPTDAPVQVVEALVNSLNAAAENLQSLLSTVDYTWNVFSRSSALMFPIIESSVDNAFDVIRGRGTAPTSRAYNTFS